MGATLSNVALSRQHIAESMLHKSTDQPTKIKTEWYSVNHSENEFAINRINALVEYYDCNIYASNIEKDKYSILLNFYNKDEIEHFKRELKSTHSTINFYKL